MAVLPPISIIPSLDTKERASILDTLFEPCTQLHTLSVSILREQTFQSYTDLISAIGDQLKALYASDLASDTEWLVAILGAHPRLGDPKPESLSAASRAEQAQLQSTSSPEAQAEAEELRKLNGQYESRFPGLRYVVFVNGRDRPTIMADMRSRIGRADPQQEILGKHDLCHPDSKPCLRSSDISTPSPSLSGSIQSQPNHPLSALFLVILSSHIQPQSLTNPT